MNDNVLGHAQLASLYATASLYVRQTLRFPGGEDGGSWTGGVF